MKIQTSFTHQGVQGFKFGYLPYGKPTFFVHIFFVDGLLIDTAQSRMRKEVLGVIENLPVQQIFLTHHHEDHSGNLTAIQEKFSVPTYASSKCVELMKKPPSISFAQWVTWGKSKANFNITPEDKHIETARYSFELIPIPGHAEDMLGLYEQNQGWFFSADLYVNDYIKFFMRNESMAQQIISIQRVLKLDFEVLFCNHNPQLKDGKKLLQSKLNFLENFYGKVSRLYQKGYSISAIYKELKLKRSWSIRLLSHGNLSTLNMIQSVFRDEQISHLTNE